MKFVYLLLPALMTSSATKVTIHTDSVIHQVEPFYVSYCMDAYLLGTDPKWLNFNFSSPRLHALMSELSPAVLRFGGSPADWTVFESSGDAGRVFNITGIKPPLTVFTENDLDNMVMLTLKTGNRFLYDLDLQFRYGSQWDPTNAYDMMKYIEQKGYGKNVDFELGNEPTVYKEPGEINISPDLIAQAFVTLSKLVRSFPSLGASNVVGPDVVNLGPPGQKAMYKVADKAGGLLNALTFHHYYFRGDIAQVGDYLNPANFRNLADAIHTVKSSIVNSSHPDIPLWIGETADAWHSGTPHVSDRFVSGFLWLEKLGLSASLGVSSVMRQTFYGHDYGLVDIDLNPNPDYWLSWVHKKLVGQKVLNITYSMALNTTRVYGHCTNSNRTGYQSGSVTLFALNMHKSICDILEFSSQWQGQVADVYLLTPPAGDASGVLSRYTAINGQVLKVVHQTEFPTITPVTEPVIHGLRIPPLTLAFYVFPKANLAVCK